MLDSTSMRTGKTLSQNPSRFSHFEVISHVFGHEEETEGKKMTGWKHP